MTKKTPEEREREWLEKGDELANQLEARVKEIKKERNPEQIKYESEFGRGLVIPLAKFSEHLGPGGNFSMYGEQTIRMYADWCEKDEEARNEICAQAKQFPNGDAARILDTVHFAQIGEDIHGGTAKTLSHLIEMWANGASDHFYELDRERAPECLCQLADLMLEMGHGFTEKTYTMEDMDTVRRLWKESCIALDEMLGTNPDWGEW